MGSVISTVIGGAVADEVDDSPAAAAAAEAKAASFQLRWRSFACVAFEMLSRLSRSES